MSEDNIRAALAAADMRQYGADMRHLLDVRETRLGDGQRVITVDNADGLHLSVLPDRGLDIWMARYRGLPLTWASPGSPFLPDSGQDLLQQFNGGLLMTCGLTHAGPPETDPDTGEQRGLHGRYSRLRAQDVRVNAGGDTGVAEISGTVWETSLFGTQLALRRTIRVAFDQPAFTISDTVTNHGDVTAPLMLVYHLNFGFPIVHAGTEMLVASEVYPRDAAARGAADRWAFYEGPTPDYPEQVFFHRPVVGADGKCGAALVNAGFGIAIQWDVAQLPYLTQWKNTRQTHYVCGIEPGTCVPEGQNAARANGRLITLEPGAVRAAEVEISLLTDADAVAQFRAEVDAARASASPVAGYSFDDI